jgi:hypothetical protein
MVLPQDCVLVFDLVHDENNECDCIVISNPSTAKQGYLIDGYSFEEDKLMNKLENCDFIGGYLIESMYEMPEDKTKDEVIEGLVSLGFGYMPGFMKDCKSI